MKRFSEQFKKQATGIKLRAHERSELRDRLNAYMEYHPLPTELRTEKVTKQKRMPKVLTEPFALIDIQAFISPWVRAGGGVFAMLLVLVPILAERAVPGDALYPVKVQFNEELRSSLALSPYAKVEWETTRLERRIAEARVLASEGKLTDAVQVEVAEAVKEHTTAVEAEIASLRAENADEAAIAEIAFSSVLAVQSEVLEETAERETDNAESDAAVEVLASVVAEVSEEVTAAGEENVPSYDLSLIHI